MMNNHGIKATRRIRFISVLLTLLMVCAFIPAAAAAVTPLSVSLGTATATAGGENVVVNVNLANVEANLPRGINNSGFTIQYDNTVLEIVSVARGNLVANAEDMDMNPGTAEEISANSGQIVLLHNDDTGGERPIISDGSYAVLTFKAKSGAAAGTYALTFKAGASSIGQMNTAGTYPEDINMTSVVLNPGAITVQESTTDNCFIATASFGSKFEPSVVLLRQFRDRFLLTNSIGQAFVEFYYKISPPIADTISKSESLKTIVRGILTPVVGVVYLLFHPELIYPLAAILLTVLMRRIQRRKTRHVSQL